LMYQMFYEVRKPAFGERVHLLYSDTDSIVLSFDTEDLSAELLPLQEHFDHSKIPRDHPLFSEVNKGVVGKFKDETNAVPILEFVGLKAKMYSYELEKRDGVTAGDMKAKGIPKAVVQRDLSHELYRKCALGEMMKPVTFNSIVSKGQLIYKTQSQKQSLDTYNSKRWLCPDRNHSLPYGHKLTARDERVTPPLHDVTDGHPTP